MSSRLFVRSSCPSASGGYPQNLHALRRKTYLANYVRTDAYMPRSAPIVIECRLKVEALVLDWLTKPADWLLSVGGFVASWFINQDTDGARFAGMQMMVATLVLAAAVALIIYWREVVSFLRSRWQTRRSGRPDVSD